MARTERARWVMDALDVAGVLAQPPSATLGPPLIASTPSPPMPYQRSRVIRQACAQYPKWGDQLKSVVIVLIKLLMIVTTMTMTTMTITMTTPTPALEPCERRTCPRR